MSNLIDEEKLAREDLAAQKYLNEVIGLISFTLGLTCLSFDNSVKIAYLCLPVVAILAVIGANNISGEIKALNQLIKETQNQEAIEEKKYHLSNQNTFQQFLKYPMYVYGFSFYLTILLMPSFSQWIKT